VTVYEKMLNGDDGISPFLPFIARALADAADDRVGLRIELWSKRSGLPDNRREDTFVVALGTPGLSQPEEVMQEVIERLNVTPGLDFTGEIRIDVRPDGVDLPRYGSFMRTVYAAPPSPGAPPTILARARAAAEAFLSAVEIVEGLDALAEEASLQVLGAGPCPGGEEECHADKATHEAGECSCGPDDEHPQYPYPEWEGQHDFDGGSCWRCRGVAPGFTLRQPTTTVSVADVERIARFMRAACDVIEAAQVIAAATPVRPMNWMQLARLRETLVALETAVPPRQAEAGEPG
jgi:hypothetical protein